MVRKSRLSECATQLACALLCIVCANADARTWYIRPDGSGDAPTIQAALDSSSAGDEILLAAGTYTWTSQDVAPQALGMLVIRNNVSLRGEGGSTSTILDGELMGRVIRVEDTATEVTIEGLSILRGYSGGGSGIDARLSSVRMNQCELRDNYVYGQWGRGGGALCNLAAVSESKFVGNRTEGGPGAGIYFEEGSVQDCVFQENIVSLEFACGGAIAATRATVSRTLFEKNRCTAFVDASGGAIRADNLTLHSSVFDGNLIASTVGVGRGAAVSMRTGRILQCIFIRNRSITESFGEGGGRVCRRRDGH